MTLEIGDGLEVAQALFSESTGRIVFTAAAEDEAVIAKRFSSTRVRILGTVEGASEDPTLVIRRRGRNTVTLRRSAMLKRFTRSSRSPQGR
jgi:poly-gamma-glutamate capsule biosynthesis protein CapA/YwtB (metallophosphatase superfamily)